MITVPDVILNFRDTTKYSRLNFRVLMSGILEKAVSVLKSFT